MLLKHSKNMVPSRAFGCPLNALPVAILGVGMVTIRFPDFFGKRQNKKPD
jgi:hypothetical protein